MVNIKSDTLKPDTILPIYIKIGPIFETWRRELPNTSKQKIHLEAQMTQVKEQSI